jgi:hypothetical protein
MGGKRPLTSRGARKLAEREREVGLDANDEAALWLEQNDPKPEPRQPKAASKSKEMHRWRRRQAQHGLGEADDA